jgi:hypothetical protein
MLKALAQGLKLGRINSALQINLEANTGLADGR